MSSFEKAAGQGSDAKAGRLGGCVSGCNLSAGVRGCARLPWPTDVPLRGNIGVVCRDFQMFEEESLIEALESRRWHDLPFFNDVAGRCFFLSAFVQRSGAPGDVRSPADARK